MSCRVIKGGGEVKTGPMLWRPIFGPRDQTLVRTRLRAEAGAREADAAGLAAQAEPGTEEAYQRGLREGEAAARGVLQPVLERLAHSIDLVAGLRARVRKEAEADLVKLSVAIARRILHRELSVDPEAILGLMKVALEKLQAQEIHRVRVHPDLEAVVRAALERFAAGRSVQVVSDRGREPGAVVFETERGNLDASVETQLQEIGRGLADRLRGRQ